jgi:hypothetical protein
VFFREILESVIQNTATPLRIDFVSVANIHNRIPCLAKGPIAAARPHRGILDSGDSRWIFVAPKETICTRSIPVNRRYRMRCRYDTGSLRTAVIGRPF